jgi:SAM-dependent methyltransferase
MKNTPTNSVAAAPRDESVDVGHAAPQAGAAIDQLIVLHVGCGAKNGLGLHSAFHGEEWQEVRLDIDPAVRPDIVSSITDMSAVKTGSVDAIWSSHNIEHLWPHDVPVALAEFRRVLRPGGFLMITLPNIKAVAQLIVEDKLEETAYMSPAGPICPIDILYGYRPSLEKGHHFMAHKTAFTCKTLLAHLQTAGFNDGKVWEEGFDLWGVVN